MDIYLSEYSCHPPNAHCTNKIACSMGRDYPNKSIEFVRAVAEGDLVVLHTQQTWPGGEQYVTMDFFRFDNNGKIVEHWDTVQEVPSETKNGNPMF